jgi:hypothetical protein
LRNSGKGIAVNVGIELVRDKDGNQVPNHNITTSDKIILPTIGDGNKNQVYLAVEKKDLYNVMNYEGYQFKFSAESISREKAFWKYEIRKISDKDSSVIFAGYTKNEAETKYW